MAVAYDTYIGNAGRATNLTGSLNHAADAAIFIGVAYAGTTSPSDVTVGGVSAALVPGSKYSQSTNESVEVWYIRRASAANETVSVTFASTTVFGFDALSFTGANVVVETLNGTSGSGASAQSALVTISAGTSGRIAVQFTGGKDSANGAGALAFAPGNSESEYGEYNYAGATSRMAGGIQGQIHSSSTGRNMTCTITKTSRTIQWATVTFGVIAPVDTKSSKSSYMEGSALSAKDSKSAYIASQGKSSKSAYIACGGKSSKSAYIASQGKDVKGAYTRGGIVDFRGDPTPKPAYTRGIVVDFRGNPTPQPAYSYGAIFLRDPVSKPAYLKGIVVDFRGDPTPKPAFTRGQIVDYRGDPTPKPAYTFGATFYRDPTPKPAYTKGLVENLRDPAPKPAYTNGSDVGNSHADAYSRGCIEDFRGAPTPAPAYLKGLDSTKEQKSAYTAGLTSATPSSKPSYLCGDAIISLSTPAYIYGAIGVSDDKSAYTEGYIEGTLVSSSVPAYMYAPEPTGHTDAFCIGLDNGLVADGILEGYTGDWQNELNQTEDIYTSLDEYPTANDGDFITDVTPETDDYYEFSITPPAGIPGVGDVVVFWRGTDQTGNGLTVTVQLRQGNTVIASMQQELTTTRTTYYFTLTAEEREDITDWEDLRIRIVPVV